MYFSEKLIFLLSLTAFFAFPVLVFGVDFNFLENLKLGDDKIDVKVLQQILNSDSETAVSLTGPGSIGNETTFFGEKTFLAVKKFQQKYFNDILLPSNMALPSGFVGFMTRMKLNNLQKSSIPIEVSKITNKNDDIKVSSNLTKPFITKITPNSGEEGISVTITGGGFEKTGNDIMTTGGIIKNISSSDGKTLNFILEMTSWNKIISSLSSYNSSIAEYEASSGGEYKSFSQPIYIMVSNKKGMSDKISFALIKKALCLNCGNQ